MMMGTWIECGECGGQLEKTSEKQDPQTLEVYSAEYECYDCGHTAKISI